MKKVIIGLLFFLTLSIVGYSQTKESTANVVVQTVQNVDTAANVIKDGIANINVTGTKAEAFIDKYSGKLEAAFVSLAKSLKTPVEHIYKVLVTQQVVKASIFIIADILLIVLSIIFSIWFGKTVNYYSKQKDDWSDYEGPCIILCATTIVCIIAAVGCTFGSLSTVVTGFINPEYGAIMDILQFIR